MSQKSSNTVTVFNRNNNKLPQTILTRLFLPNYLLLLRFRIDNLVSVHGIFLPFLYAIWKNYIYYINIFRFKTSHYFLREVKFMLNALV